MLSTRAGTTPALHGLWLHRPGAQPVPRASRPSTRNSARRHLRPLRRGKPCRNTERNGIRGRPGGAAAPAHLERAGDTLATGLARTEEAAAKGAELG